VTQIGSKPCTLPKKIRSLMSEMIELKMNAIFETRVIEYQSGGALSWD
jgi:hypothetical protein